MGGFTCMEPSLSPALTALALLGVSLPLSISMFMVGKRALGVGRRVGG